MFEFVLVMLLLFAFMIGAGIKVVPINTMYVIERLGSYHRTIEKEGLYYLIFLFDKIVKKIPKNEQIIAVELDLVKIDMFYQVVDAKLFTYGVSDHEKALTHLVSTLYKNNELNTKLCESLSVWGIKLINVVIHNK